MFLPAIHRVVTGHDASGKAVIASNGPLPVIVALEALPGMVFHEVWETQGTPASVDNADDPTSGPMMHEAPEHGTRLRFVDFPPDASYLADAGKSMEALFAEVNHPEGLTTQPGSPHPMMHRTESVDYGILIDGEMTLILDDSEILLTAGSVVIQRGTNHAWANRTGRTCRMLFIQIDGQYVPAVAAALARR